MADLLITGGHVIDPGQSLDAPADVLLQDGRVAFVGASDEARNRAAPDAETLDAAGRVVTPGWIDIHVHLREPGMEGQETIASGAAAAVAGGVASVACMPNTDPPLDSEASITFVLQEAERAGLANVFPVGAITSGRRGDTLAEMGRMAGAGAVAFSDDGSSVPTAGLLRRAMSYAKMLGRPILEHCEDASLVGGGVMNEGYVSTVLGLPGIPAEAEEIVVARDVALARLTGAHIHIQHVSTAGSVEILRRAKEEGIHVTAEVCPHHLVLTDEAVRGYNSNFKVNPPLRGERDVEACRAGLKDGVIDAIATDHAPHRGEDKEREFIAAPFGMIGLETAVGVLLTRLVHEGRLPLAELIPFVTTAPAAVLGLDRGTLAPGRPGDVTILDPERSWVVDPARFRSRSTNCPWNGERLRGKAVATVVGGRVVYRDTESE